ncbi:MAG: MFS transporter [Anaerolineaceae bacterium]|nr:MFS transporter [Anaerolineaceae bacterium]
MQSSSSSSPKNMKAFITILIGELISMLGSGLTGFAMGVWIFEKTGQATPFAITVLFASLPPILLAPFAGSLADRWNRRLIMIIADTGSALTTLAALILLINGDLNVWAIYIIAGVGSAFGAFQETAFQASVVMLVEKKDLARANGMAQTIQAVSMLVTPVLAGVLFGVIGLRGVMTIDFITFFAAIAALLIVRIPQPKLKEETAGKANAWEDTKLGWNFIRTRAGLLGLGIFFMLVNFMLNFSAVLTGPLVLSTHNAAMLGTVQMFGGVGMLLGSLAVSTFGAPKKRVLTMFTVIFISSLGLGLAGLRDSIITMSIGFFIMMLVIPFASASSQAIFQVKVPADMQGRVFAIRTIFARLMMPVAFLISGPLADKVFEPLMMEGGSLAQSFLGQLLGVGPGRGIGFMYLIGMVGMLFAILISFANPRIRNVETELPDVIEEPEEAPQKPEPHGEPIPVMVAD